MAERHFSVTDDDVEGEKARERVKDALRRKSKGIVGRDKIERENGHIGKKKARSRNTGSSKASTKNCLNLLWERRELLTVFREHLYHVGNAFNLRFYLECKLFAKVEDVELLSRRAHEIFDAYINPRGMRALDCITDSCYKCINQGLSSINRHLFEPALAVVIQILQKDFEKFRKCEKYPKDLPNEETLPNIRRIRSQTIMYYEYMRKIKRSEETAKSDPGIRVLLYNNPITVKEPADDDSKLTFEKLFEHRELMRAFEEFLKISYAQENLYFIISVDSYMALRDQEERTARALEIFEQFVHPSAATPINLSHESVKLVQEKLENPAEIIFEEARDIVMNYLKNDYFPDFKMSENCPKWPLPQKRKEEKTIELYDTLVKIRKSNSLKKSKKAPQMEDIYTSRDLLMDFREFVYYRHSQEHLQFALECEIYRRTNDPKERVIRAEQIYSRFCQPDGKDAVNIDEMLVEMIEEKMKGRNLPKDLFHDASEAVMVILQHQLWPQFLRSEMYSPPKKKKDKKVPAKLSRRNTIKNYEELRARLKVEERTAPPTWDAIWSERDLMLSFCSFLHEKKAENRIRFVLHAELFTEESNDEKRKEKGHFLYKEYIKPNSVMHVPFTSECVKVTQFF